MCLLKVSRMPPPLHPSFTDVGTLSWKGWRCEHCPSDIYSSMMALLVPRPPELEQARAEMEELQRRGADQKSWERFIEDHLHPSGVLHPTHFRILWAKQEIANLGTRGLQDRGEDPSRCSTFLLSPDTRSCEGQGPDYTLNV